ncbi:23S rRNA (adenine(2503)-C(2))-methyltransferase RlmN [Patescibacteria group bacterium]|nr:23S rRNA (adenine(2503)-C(2))-methyltransferase RlmN [Patescibacteria group bacterium]
MDIKALKNRLDELKIPDYRLKQALRSYYQEYQNGWQDISTWSKNLREACMDISWSPLELEQKIKAHKKDSTKYLFKTKDEKFIESVLMEHEDGRTTVCVSSQIGCAMNCTFCATGALGYKRNLTAEEIVDQVVQIARDIKTQGKKVTNIVFMGMGEPFNNPDEVFVAIKKLMDKELFGLGARHISVSTCGIIPGIQRLMRETPQVNLAISLHAPNQKLREKLMPIAKAYPLNKLMQALGVYMQQTNRKVMFEYLLIKGVNDSLECADELIHLLSEKKQLVHVNLIKYHATGTYQPSPEGMRRLFQDRLRKFSISVTHRVSFGEDISAACGQLAAKKS